MASKVPQEGLYGLLKTMEKTPFCERCDCFILWLLHVSCTYLFVCLETIAWGCSSLGAVMKEQHGLDKLYLTSLFRWRWIVFVLFPGAKTEEISEMLQCYQMVEYFHCKSSNPLNPCLYETNGGLASIPSGRPAVSSDYRYSLSTDIFLLQVRACICRSSNCISMIQEEVSEQWTTAVTTTSLWTDAVVCAFKEDGLGFVATSVRCWMQGFQWMKFCRIKDYVCVSSRKSCYTACNPHLQSFTEVAHSSFQN